MSSDFISLSPNVVLQATNCFNFYKQICDGGGSTYITSGPNADECSKRTNSSGDVATRNDKAEKNGL